MLGESTVFELVSSTGNRVCFQLNELGLVISQKDSHSILLKSSSDEQQT